MKPTKWVIAGAAVVVYAACPAYRYYVIGSWVAYKILQDKQRYRVVRKESKEYRRIVAG